jgi:hypothetical protein
MSYPLPAICHQRRLPHAGASERVLRACQRTQVAEILRRASCIKCGSPSRPNRFPGRATPTKGSRPRGHHRDSATSATPPCPRIEFRNHACVDSPLVAWHATFSIPKPLAFLVSPQVARLAHFVFLLLSRSLGLGRTRGARLHSRPRKCSRHFRARQMAVNPVLRQ